MVYRVDTSRNIIVFRPSGRIDISNAQEFESILDKLMVLNPKHSFIIDLEKIEYFSSSALRVIITTYRKLHEASLGMILLRPTGICMKILEITKLDEVIEIYDSEMDAINALN